MKRVLIALSLVVATACVAPGGPPDPTADPPLRDRPLPASVRAGSEYDAVRGALQAGGYFPAPESEDRADTCRISQALCTRYPEVQACAGTGKGNCLMSWVRGKVKVTIVTVYDDPKIIDSVSQTGTNN
jgi:hypothetical protein